MRKMYIIYYIFMENVAIYRVGILCVIVSMINDNILQYLILYIIYI